MKTKIKLLASLLTTLALAGVTATGFGMEPGQKDTLMVFNSPGLEKIAGRVVEEYSKSAPEAEIIISVATQGQLDRMLANGNDFAIISRENELNLAKERVWVTVIGRDIIVPVYNSYNPSEQLISSSGINPMQLARLVKQGSGKWSDMLPAAANSNVNFYFPADIFIRERVAGYLGLTPDVMGSGKLYDISEVIAGVRSDKSGIGFCRLTDLLSLNNGMLPAGIGILPLDRNGNGILSPAENIYKTAESFERGVWIGKYPRELYSNIYFLTNGNPASRPAGMMLGWILTDGQELLSSGGYSELIQAERVTSMSKLAPVPSPAPAGNKGSERITKMILAAFVLILVAVITELFLRPRRRRRAVLNYSKSAATALTPDSVRAPGGIFFDKYHTWAFMEKNGEVRIGIDDMIQKITGPITRVEIAETGSMVKRGEKIVTLIQNGKQVHLFSPVTGRVILRNEPLQSSPGVLLNSPYDEGWLCTVEPLNWMKEIQLMQLSVNYKKWISEEITRFKDFMTSVISANPVEARLHPVMQDGGEISSGLLAGYGPHVWEEFQVRFLNTPR